MVDAGRKFTDKQIAEIEKQLKKEYQTALKEMQEKSIKVLEQFEKNDKKMVAKVNAREITYGQYREWRKKNMLRTKQTEGLIKDLTERVVHSDEIAADYINQRIPAVYAENYNFATYDIENQIRIDTNFTLMSEDAVSGLVTGRTPIFPIANVNIPKDMRWNEKKIRSALTQGLLQGESVQKVAKRLQKVTDMDRNAATRNARTMMGRAQNTGRMESIKRAHNLGLPVKKMWIATLDSRTRDSHVNLDGEIREYDEPFSNGLDHPHGMGDPAEVYNCRCDMRPIYKGQKFDASDLGLRNTDKLGSMSYEDWKDEHKRHEWQKTLNKSKSKEKETSKPKQEKPIKINPQKMTRNQLESTAYKIAQAMAKEQGITKDEALRRAKLLMPSQSVPQLRKYIGKHKKYLQR